MLGRRHEDVMRSMSDAIDAKLDRLGKSAEKVKTEGAEIVRLITAAR